MAEIVNLNRARKARVKAGGAKRAEENRARFGRTKTEKAMARALAEKAARELEGKKRD